MPGFDRTGPLGGGPRTGGGFGLCGPGAGTGSGRGYGLGVGRGGRPRGGGRGRCFGGGGGYAYGRGYGRGYGRFGAFGADADIASLQAQADELRAELDAVEARLAETLKKADDVG